MAATDHNIPIEYLREAFAYDPETGVLTWLARPLAHFKDQHQCDAWNTQHAGEPTGCVIKPGYLVVGLKFGGKQRHLRAHRIAWALVTGRWPEHEVDHRNGVGTDNRWDNLREATSAENSQNLKALRTNNTSGFQGVSRERDGWRAQIKVGDQGVYLGNFANPESAFRAYLKAKTEHHPFAPEPRGMNEAEAAIAAEWWFEKEAQLIAARREMNLPL